MKYLQRVKQKNVQNISYGNGLAHLLLWQKAALLIPIWAVIVVPLIGFICRGFGSMPMQLGFGLSLGLLCLYFFEDILKRRIRLDDDHLFFGYRAFPIKDINSVNVEYKKTKFLPGFLAITSRSGRKLKLRLDGLTSASVETLLRHLQTRNSTLDTAAVISTLIKCRSTKRKPVDNSASLEIALQSKPVIDESIDSYRATARQWARLGPLITWLSLTPVWLTLLAFLYVCLQPHAYWSQSSNINLHEFLTHFFSGIFQTIGTLFKHPSSPEQPVRFSAESWAITAGFFALIAYLVKQCLKPNWLVADSSGVQHRVRVGLIDWKLNQALWPEINGVSFQRDHSNKLVLNKPTSKLTIDLATITAEDRTLLLKRIEKNLPSCEIDSSLSQSMLAKSDHSYTELWLQSLNQPRERKTLDPLEPGQLIADSRFEVLRSLGVGGQGTAYLCRETCEDSNQTIVLKETIIPVFADSSVRRKSLERFEKEAKLLKSLCHDGIVQLRDFFVEDHRAYLVLEHINGINLRQRVLDQGPLDNETVRDLAAQMCDILEFLHSHGVVHRDFTPDNLIFESTGRIKLIDFNVAQQIQAGSSGTIVGKHAYVPPEQFRGKATTQSDIYAFGATLFFLLTGKDPEPISQSSPANVTEAVDSTLNQVVMQATALQPENRYVSAAQAKDDLLNAHTYDEGAYISTETTDKTKVELNG